MFYKIIKQYETVIVETLPDRYNTCLW